jgi:hypothetical protein
MVLGLQRALFIRIPQPLRFSGSKKSAPNTQPRTESDGDDAFTKSPQATNSASPPEFHPPTEDSLLKWQLSHAVQQALASLRRAKVITETEKSQLLADIAKSKNPLKTALNSEIFQDNSTKTVLKNQFKTSIRLPKEACEDGIYLNLRSALARLHQESPDTFERLLGKKDYKIFKERLEEKEPLEEGVPSVTFDDILARYFGPSDDEAG